MRCAKFVLGMVREPPVQPRVNEHEEVEPQHRPGLYCARLSNEPEQQSDERHMEEHERAAGGLIRHVPEHVEDTPFPFVNGVEFMS